MRRLCPPACQPHFSHCLRALTTYRTRCQECPHPRRSKYCRLPKMVEWDDAEWSKGGDKAMWYCQGRARPLYRGRMHFLTATMAPLWVGYQLSLCASRDAFAASLISLMATCWQFAASGVYHTCNFSREGEELAARFDYIGIFLQIAFGATPHYVLLLPRETGWRIVQVLAMTAVAGSWLTFSNVRVNRHFMTCIYLLQAAVQLPVMTTRLLSDKSVLECLMSSEVSMLVWMILCYLGSSQVYAHATPALWPRTFGFHELAHLLIFFGGALVYGGNCSIIRRLGGS